MAKAKKVADSTTSTGYTIKKRLTGNLFKLEKGAPLAVEITSAIRMGRPQKNAKKDDKPADICDVINLATGEEGQIIVPAMIKSTLEEVYPKEAYVGLCFEITKGDAKKSAAGRQYNTFSIVEIEV